MARLVVEAEPAQGLSTRKLLLESAKHNVLSAYSPEEGVRMFRRFPEVDIVAIDGSFGKTVCTQLAKKSRRKAKIFVSSRSWRKWSALLVGRQDHQLSRSGWIAEAAGEMGGRTDIA